jgi:hypothetical protein
LRLYFLYAGLMLSGCALSSVASADARPPSAQLNYQIEPGAETCPSADTLKAAVQARLGYDPFSPQADEVVEVSVRREHGRYVALVSIHLPDGSLRQREPLTSSATDCSEIASTLALAISIAIDPLTFVRPASTAVEENDSPPSPVVNSPVEEKLPPSPTKAGLGWEAGVGATGSLGALPSASAGLMLFGGAATRVLRLDVEGRYDFPASKNGPEGSAVHGSLLLGTLTPCWTPRPASFCALASVGALPGEGSGVDNRATADAFYAALGVRAGVELPTTGRVRGRLQIDAYFPLRSTTLRVVGTNVWTSPAVFGTLSLVVALHSS